ncbi:MAG: ribosome recycling factor [Clostridiales bacterium]|nr:ribosome recycling factor [Clostridiales bacterium]
MNEMVEMTLMEFEDNLNKQYDRLLDEFLTIRVGRANPRLIENIKVDYYGTRAPLMQTSNITVQDARMLVVTPYDVSTLRDIKIGIESANLGVSVSDDGKIIRVGFPMLTEERRREYTKDAKKLLEEAKIAMRNARRDCLDVFKDMKKNSEISEDDYATLDKEVQKKLDTFTDKADASCEKKIAEIMEV